MIYAGYHIVMRDGRYIVYAGEGEWGYVERKGTFNSSSRAKKYIRALRASGPAKSDRTEAP